MMIETHVFEKFITCFIEKYPHKEKKNNIRMQNTVARQ